MANTYNPSFSVSDLFRQATSNPGILSLGDGTIPISAMAAQQFAPSQAPMQVPMGSTPIAPPQQTPDAGILSSADLNSWADQQSQKQLSDRLQKGEGTARDQALWSGLIGAGAGLLKGRRSPGEALGAGLEGFNTAYDTELIANRPKVTPVGNGAFSQITWPDGKVELISNKEAQAYLQGNMEKQAQIAFGKDLRRGSIESIRNDLKQNKETQQKLIEQVNMNEPQLVKLESALKVVDGMKPGENLLNLPGINQAAQAFNIGGADTISKLKQLTDVKVDETLMNTARTKGAISNQEMELFQKPIPTDYASPEVWKAWLTNRISVLRKYNDFVKAQAGSLKTDMSEAEMRQAVSGGAEPSASPAPAGGGPKVTYTAATPDQLKARGINPEPGKSYAIGSDGELYSK